MKQYPSKCFALALYPKFAYFKANSKPKDVGSDVIIFFQDQKILVQSLRKLKEGQPVGKRRFLFWITHPTRLLGALSKREQGLKKIGSVQSAK